MRLNTALKNYVRLSNSKLRIQKMRKAFEIMRQRALIHREADFYRKKLIIQKVTEVFQNLVDI